MTCISSKYIKSNYLNVAGILKDGKKNWHITINGYSRELFKTEKEAAIAVDKILIKKGKEPVNILKRINKQ